MLKVTLKLCFYCVIVFLAACKGQNQQQAQFETAHIKDSISEARIDSANTAIKSQCDTMMKYQVPKMVDSLLKDSALLLQFFNSNKLYADEDKKVEKIVRQLQADCDSNLLTETYRIVQLRQKAKPKQRPKKKV